MKLFLMFEVDDLNQAQKVIGAVGALGIKPSDMRYSLPTPQKPLRMEMSDDVATEMVENIANKIDEVAADTIKNNRPNVSPGEPSIGKIGSQTRENLLFTLPRQPEAKFAEHMKLLWKRGEVKFDGKEYYL